MNLRSCLTFLAAFALHSCGNNPNEKTNENVERPDTVATAYQQNVQLPAPFATKSAQKFSKVIGWPAGKTPTAPAGFQVGKFADSLNNPRWIYVAANGDIFVSQASTSVSAVTQVAGVLSGKSKSQNLGNS